MLALGQADPVEQVPSGDPGCRQTVGLGVERGKVQHSVVVKQAVTGEVEQEHVIPASGGEEILYAAAQFVFAFVDAGRLEVEFTDFARTEQESHGLDVPAWGQQLFNIRIAVEILDGNQQGPSASCRHGMVHDGGDWHCLTSARLATLEAAPVRCRASRTVPMV
jgi:hypothetical protein